MSLSLSTQGDDNLLYDLEGQLEEPIPVEDEPIVPTFIPEERPMSPPIGAPENCEEYFFLVCAFTGCPLAARVSHVPSDSRL